jgi:hypothetical protein
VQRRVRASGTKRTHSLRKRCWKDLWYGYSSRQLYRSWYCGRLREREKLVNSELMTGDLVLPLDDWIGRNEPWTSQQQQPHARAKTTRIRCIEIGRQHMTARPSPTLPQKVCDVSWQMRIQAKVEMSHVLSIHTQPSNQRSDHHHPNLPSAIRSWRIEDGEECGGSARRNETHSHSQPVSQKRIRADRLGNGRGMICVHQRFGSSKQASST